MVEHPSIPMPPDSKKREEDQLLAMARKKYWEKGWLTESHFMLDSFIVDMIAWREDGTKNGQVILLEAKSDITSRSIAAGLGQLLLYKRAYRSKYPLPSVELVLLLPQRPAPLLDSLLRENGVSTAIVES